VSGFSATYLQGLADKALSHCGPNAQQYEFVLYLMDQIEYRISRGQSMDCDEYRALLGMAKE
jgi:hypothetical protein